MNVVLIVSLIIFAATVANGVRINVWIQSEKVGTEWQFHDGSPMPMDTDDVCVRVLTDVPHETRIRVRGSTEFKCWDHEEAEQFSYLCEYYRKSVLT